MCRQAGQRDVADCARPRDDDVVTITESEIVDSMWLVMERMKVLGGAGLVEVGAALSNVLLSQVVVEPSGAAGLAAVLSPQFRALHGSGKRVGVILCGGNLDLAATGFWDHWRSAS